LALRQPALVRDCLVAAHPELGATGAVEIVTIRTTGDGCSTGCSPRSAARGHTVELEEPSPRIFEVGPAFRDLADPTGMTGTALKVFPTSSHPKMPNLILTPEEIPDLTAYILS